MRYDIESIKKRKEKSNNLKKIINIFVVILVYNIVLIIALYTNEAKPISFFGFKAYIISSDSMFPTIEAGDFIITKKYDKNLLKKGDMITFRQDNEVITHRIIDIEKEENKCITRGDNNNIEDAQKVEFGNIQGKVVLIIPYLGKVINFFKDRIVFLVFILASLIIYFYRIIIIERKENRKEKKELGERKKYKKKDQIY